MPIKDDPLNGLTDDERTAALDAVAKLRAEKAKAARTEEQRRKAAEALTSSATVTGLTTPVVYAARQNSNLDDGRGPIITKALFVLAEDAEKARDFLPGVFGSRNTCEVETLPLWLSFEDWHHHYTRKDGATLTVAKDGPQSTWPEVCPTCGGAWKSRTKTMGKAHGQPHQGICINNHHWNET